MGGMGHATTGEEKGKKGWCGLFWLNDGASAENETGEDCLSLQDALPIGWWTLCILYMLCVLCWVGGGRCVYCICCVLCCCVGGGCCVYCVCCIFCEIGRAHV